MAKLGRDLQTFLPHCLIEMGLGELPFHNDVADIGSYFDPATFATKNEANRNKMIKKDIVTSVRATLRSVERQNPAFVVGDGPGAIVALGLSRPEFVEETLRFGNVQQVEIEKMAPKWAQILMIVCRKPMMTKSMLDVDLLERLLPNLFKTGDVESDIVTLGVGRTDAVNSGVPLRDKGVQFFERAHVPRHSSIDGIDWKAATSFPRRSYWGHEGICGCGKRVYLYPRCFSCKRKDKLEEDEDVEAFLARTAVRGKQNPADPLSRSRGRPTPEPSTKAVVVTDEVDEIEQKTELDPSAASWITPELPEPEAEDDLTASVESALAASDLRRRSRPWTRQNARSGGKGEIGVDVLTPNHVLERVEQAGGFFELVKEPLVWPSCERKGFGLSGDDHRTEFSVMLDVVGDDPWAERRKFDITDDLYTEPTKVAKRPKTV